jgi:hypothetical protein
MKYINLQILTYNEESRIADALETAKIWAKNIFVIDKNSTDSTVSIAKKNGCSVIKIPFSPQGSENYIDIWEILKKEIDEEYPWVLTLTPGETPSRELINIINSIASNKEFDSNDVICLPVKLMTFGKFRQWGPWQLSSQPRLLNSKLAQVRNQVHNHIVMTEKTRAINVDNESDIFILHPTHRDFSSFIKTHHDYALTEEFNSAQDDRVSIAFQKAVMYDHDFFNKNLDTDIRPLVAWKIYCYMVALKTLDSQHSIDSKNSADQIIKELRLKDWGLS